MSTATGLIPTGDPLAAARPLPWRNLIWVAWRRHRPTAGVIAAVLAALTIYLVSTGLSMRSAWHDVQACTPQNSRACSFAWDQFQNTHSDPGVVSALFLFAPLLIGAFVGAPVIGRELEHGTFRYAWTQGAGRIRWAVAMIVGGAVAVAVLTGAFGALVAWHDRPLWQADITPRLGGGEFPATGVAVIGWGLAAYAAAVLAGLLWRRVLPALGTAVVAVFALAFAASRLRLHYLAPLRTRSLDHVVGSQVVAQWWQQGATHVGYAELNGVLRAAGLSQIQISGGKTAVQAAPGPGGGTDPISYLLSRGYAQWTSYQPAGRYWAFQWIEFGWLAALAVLLLTITLLLLRRRDA